MENNNKHNSCALIFDWLCRSSYQEASKEKPIVADLTLQRSADPTRGKVFPFKTGFETLKCFLSPLRYQYPHIDAIFVACGRELISRRRVAVLARSQTYLDVPVIFAVIIEKIRE